MGVIGGVNFGRRAGVGALLAGSLLVATACSADNSRDPVPAAAPQKVAAAQLKITPADGSTKVRTDKGVTVTATGGSLETVSVTARGKQVEGTFNADRTEWRASWPLAPSTSYKVDATAKNSIGILSTATGGFTTLKPTNTISASLDWILEENKGEKYGVGMPIILNFDQPVANKDQVEKALEVKAEKPIEGAWRWYGDQQVVYRTKKYWPAHQTVKLTAHLAGVRAAKNVYGAKNLTRSFEIGASRVSKVNLKSHKMTVYVDGKKKRTVPVSGGNGSTTEYTTTSGVHLTMEKGNPVRMIAPGRKKGDPGYYDELIGYAVRISNSGEYLHQTPGDYYCLGRANCSHGCIRQPADDAVWFYRNARPGDVVIVTGTSRKLTDPNGWSMWQVPWSKWRKSDAAQ